MLINYLMVGLGGAAGSILRAALTKCLPSTFINIPLQILLINILGCFTMGLITELLAWYSISDIFRYFLISGFLGGFTTFSAFALEFGLLYQKDLYLSGITYIILSVTLSLLGFFLGRKIILMLVTLQ